MKSQLTVPLVDWRGEICSTSVHYTTAMRHLVFVGVLRDTVVVKGVHDAQVQNHTIQYLEIEERDRERVTF